MTRDLPVVLDAQLSEGVIARVRQALGPTELVSLELEELNSTEAELRRMAALLVVSQTTRHATSHVIRGIRNRMPGVGILVASLTTESLSTVRRSLADAGADYVLRIDRDGDLRWLASYARRRTLLPPPESALRSLALVTLEPTIAPLVHWTVRNACFRPSIEQAGVFFWTTSRTLSRRLAKHGVPRFGRLKGLGIVLHAREAVLRYGLTQAEVSRRLGMREPSHLSRLIRRWQVHLGMSEECDWDALLASERLVPARQSSCPV